jgi:acetyl esterase/lipase
VSVVAGITGFDTPRREKPQQEFESIRRFMPSRLISFLILTVVALPIPVTVTAQQDTNAKTAGTQTGNSKSAANVNLPVSKENWGSPSDIKTGLEPLPAVAGPSDNQAEFVRDLIRLEWRDNDPIDVWLIRPKVAGKVPEKVPVILYLYSFSDKDDRFRDNAWCQRATSDGYAALGFVSALTDYRFRNRSLKKWFISELAESLGSTTHDVQLILNYLAQRGDIDMSRVGMFGLGSGGTIAILAAAADPRITALDVLDPWGDWPDWFGKSTVVPQEELSTYQSKEFLQRIATLDPVAYLPSLKTPSFRLQQIVNDPVTPSLAKQRIADAVSLHASIVKYQNAGDLYKSWQTAGLSGWIKEQLHPQQPKGPNDDHHVAKNK